MTDTISNLVPDGIGYDNPLARLSGAALIEHHRKQLHAIAFNKGLDGVQAYKRKHPVAAGIRVNINALASVNKPAGYDDAIAKLAKSWLTDVDAVDQTNKADVKRLNRRFGSGRFNPANHFSKPLSAGRRAKLKALFLEHDVHLDTDKADTLSKVKAAAKAARGSMSADRPFGTVGVISGNNLVIGGQSFGIEKHHGRDCIRVPMEGDRVRIRLDALEAVIGGLSGRVQPSPTYSLRSIGELAPEPETPDFDPLETRKPVGLVPASHSEMVELAPASSCAPSSLADRIAATKAARSVAPCNAWDGTGDDPLNHLI